MKRSRMTANGSGWGVVLLAWGLLSAGCRHAAAPREPIEPRLEPGDTVVKDGSHGASLLLYDGHLVGNLKSPGDVAQTVDRLTPPGTYSVMIGDDKQRVFNVDSLERLENTLRDVEAVQGPLAPDVPFTIRSRDGPAGAVRGKPALREFFRARYGAAEPAP